MMNRGFLFIKMTDLCVTKTTSKPASVTKQLGEKVADLSHQTLSDATPHSAGRGIGMKQARMLGCKVNVRHWQGQESLGKHVLMNKL